MLCAIYWEDSDEWMLESYTNETYTLADKRDSKQVHRQIGYYLIVVKLQVKVKREVCWMGPPVTEGFVETVALKLRPE